MSTYRSIASFAATGGSPFTCSKPSGTIEGDVLLGFHVADGGVAASGMALSGGATWQPLFSYPATPVKIWWKVAGSSEPSSYNFTHTGATVGSLVDVVAVQGASSLTPFVAETNVGSTNSISTPNLVPSGSADLDIRWVCNIGAASNSTWTPPALYTEIEDFRIGTTISSSIAIRQLTSNTAPGGKTFTCSSSANFVAGFTVGVGSSSSFSGWGMPI